jgi:cell division protein FtsB
VSSGRLAAVALILLVLVISYASSLRAWLAQRDELVAARAELAQTRERVDDLQTGKARWQDSAYVMQEARERLGFVLPGEVGYRVLGADGEVVGSEVSLDDPVDTQVPPTDWYASIWASVQKAGTRGEAK